MGTEGRLEPILNIVEKIARRHDSGSEEYSSIELAAKALLFIHTSGQEDAFDAYVASLSEELTDAERQVLAALGVE